MLPEPERSREKLASRREAKEGGGRGGSMSAMLYLMSRALGVLICASIEEEACFRVRDDDDEGIGAAEREEEEGFDAKG